MFDLINYLDLLWDEGENVIFSVDDSPGIFRRNWLPPQLYNTGVLEVTGVRFDAIVRSLFHAGIITKSLLFGIEPMMSDVMEYGHDISMTTSARSWGGESRCSEWLQFVSNGARLMAPPIGARFCTVVFFWSGGCSICGLCTLGGNQLESCK